MINFSLVSTVFNEARRLKATIDDLENQIVRPSQIVIVDAGSGDGTFEMLESWKRESSIDVVVLQSHGCNVAQGRNLAIRHASHDLIVSTDFGCRFDPRWTQSIVSPFSDPSITVVGGAYTVSENEISSVAARANYILTNGYKVVLNEYFIPSSRSIAYYKSVWKDVGGYCEWLTLAADDLIFGMALKANNYRIKLVPEPYVFWGRHERAKSYAKEAFRYGLGDGEARTNVRNTLSMAVECMLRYLLFASIALIVANVFVNFFPMYYALAAIIFLPGLRSYVFAFRNFLKLRSRKYHFGIFCFALMLIEHTRWNYLKGFIKGYFFSPAHVKKSAHLFAEKYLTPQGK